MNDNQQLIWKMPIKYWGLILLSLVLLGVYFYDALAFMVQWWSREEYSHGPLIPLIAIFFIWQMKDSLEKIPFSNSYFGLVLLVLGLLIGLVGNLSTIYTVSQYAFLIALSGLVLSIVGWRAFALIWVPLAMLLFMIPLPNFFYNNLSQKLQLISSAIGVEVIRLFGVSVFLEGNVIDLGNYKLQVVEACNGLRYLFPLMSFGFICAYLFKAPFWQRAIVFLSTIPITILMNSFRIGVIGVLVDRWGTEQAEGFLHDFEGWVIFMACVAILFAEMWLLNRIFNKEKQPLREVFGLVFPEPSPEGAEVQQHKISKPFIASILVTALAVMATLGIENREEAIPLRTSFESFPEQFGDWHGKTGKMEEIYIEGLTGMTDHVIADYVNPEGNRINFYAAYYESQRSGGAIHSPKSCIPGGGWVISEITQVPLEGVFIDGKVVVANRVEIAKGQYKQLVYYWFQQRGRSVSNEYLLKWYLFWDSLTHHRSDGALVRLTTFMDDNENWEEGDQRINIFANELGDKLKEYVPEW